MKKHIFSLLLVLLSSSVGLSASIANASNQKNCYTLTINDNSMDAITIIDNSFKSIACISNTDIAENDPCLSEVKHLANFTLIDINPVTLAVSCSVPANSFYKINYWKNGATKSEIFELSESIGKTFQIRRF